ncbi:MAG: lipoyl domain-containing protein [Rhodobacteraceae bacterium]|nr:lipoyl domain-containing protein [Paracoccaceae bacterium]MCY4195935.1 lipoyl domain-containing protein [Paracoccaceae bacterium]MCY4327972.1 lipoyl domain-containing protein [Paracoccaceae bacterium]
MARVAVKIPDLGNEVTEAQIDSWLKSPGDMISQGEEIVAITTPKVTVELEAPASGRIVDILVEPDEIVAVGTILAIIET